MTKKSHLPVASFGPELMAALLQGAAHDYSIQMPWKIAVRFRQRVYQLRAAMRAEKHEKLDLVSRVRIIVSWPKGTRLTKVAGNSFEYPHDPNTECTVRIAPADSEFADILNKAGITPHLGTDDIEIISVNGGGVIEELLRGIK